MSLQVLNPSSSTSSLTATAIEVDFGTSPLFAQTFTITDGTIAGTSKILVVQDATVASAGKAQDDNELDALICRAVAGTGSFTLYIDAVPGPVVGKFRLLYLVDY